MDRRNSLITRALVVQNAIRCRQACSSDAWPDYTVFSIQPRDDELDNQRFRRQDEVWAIISEKLPEAGARVESALHQLLRVASPNKARARSAYKRASAGSYLTLGGILQRGQEATYCVRRSIVDTQIGALWPPSSVHRETPRSVWWTLSDSRRTSTQDPSRIAVLNKPLRGAPRRVYGDLIGSSIARRWSFGTRASF